MAGIEITASLVDGSALDFLETGQKAEDLVKLIAGDDCNPPVKWLSIKITTEKGAVVEIEVPNRPSSVSVSVDGREI